MARRDQPPKQKSGVPRAEFVGKVTSILDEMHAGLFERAKAHRAQHTHQIDKKEDFYAFFTPPRGGKKSAPSTDVADVDSENAPTPIHGGFALTHFSGDIELEQKIKDELSVTVRCIPLEEGEPGTCPFTGKPSKQRVIWAKSY
jgi:prolyl-tRNA synthetase